MSVQSERRELWRCGSDHRLTRDEDAVATEAPLEIRVNGRPIAVTMRTPGHDEELTVGFLLSEGVIRSRADIARVRRCPEAPDDLIEVLTSEGVAVDLDRLTRHVFASSSCGVCGTASIQSVRKQFPPVARGPGIDPRAVNAMPGALRAAQRGFDATGGLHGAGLFDPAGALVVAREDVGRHNAVDKVIGRALLDALVPLGNHALMVSGRASFEIVQKAVAAGIPIVAAVSAPSSLAVELADEAGVTLLGFVRDGRFNVYAHPERLDAAAPGA